MVDRHQPNFIPMLPSGLIWSGVMMTTPCGHSAPTHREPFPYALGQPNSWSRQGVAGGTGCPIVTGQFRASAIVTGRVGYTAGAADVRAGASAVARAVLWAGWPSVQPARPRA